MPEKHPNQEFFEEKAKEWRETYSYSRLKNWEKDELKRQMPLFRNEVDRFRVRFKRGRLATDEMLAVTDEWSGEQPLTSFERQKLTTLEEEILGNFRQAIGYREKKKKQARTRAIERMKELFDSMTEFVLSVLLLLKSYFP
jgi:hypothetical protein